MCRSFIMLAAYNGFAEGDAEQFGAIDNEPMQVKAAGRRGNMNCSKPLSIPGRNSCVVGFAAHTLTVYLCAIHLSPSFVSAWFRVTRIIFHSVSTTVAGNWYLQHLMSITIIPALLVGFLTTALFGMRAGAWAWSGPVLVLVWEIIKFQVPHSVLINPPMSPLRYFFEIQPAMPTDTNYYKIDVVRTLAQMVITAPFYAGIAYSTGVILAQCWRKSSASKNG